MAIVALALSGIANGIRVPPITGLTMQRIPRPIRAETMTAASSLVTGAGFFALLAAGPALDRLDIAVVWVRHRGAPERRGRALPGFRGRQD